MTYSDDGDVSLGVTCPVHGEECPHSGCSHCLGGPSLLSLLLQGRDISQMSRNSCEIMLSFDLHFNSGDKLTLSTVYY